MLLMPAVLPAHNTLFGDAPRTIWKNGIEVEAETEWEIFRRTVHEDSTLSNPHDTRVQMWTYKFALTYGFTKDISMRLGVPIGYAIRRSKDTNLNDHYWGLRDMNLGFKFRLYNEPHPGGSFQGGVFIDFKLPTAQRRDGLGMMGKRMAFGNETLDTKVGVTWSYSTTRHYFWLDVAARISTLNDGRVPGPSASIHPAYALRVFELNDYRELDLILLFEADAEIAGRNWLDRKRVVPSGHYKFHIGGGIQMNITNRIEIKFGYEWPFYQYYFAPTFVHEGQGKFSFNYLF